jgi:hypothetical protein
VLWLSVLELLYNFGWKKSDKPEPKMRKVLSDEAAKILNKTWNKKKTVFKANTLGRVVRTFLEYTDNPFEAVHTMAHTVLTAVQPKKDKKDKEKEKEPDADENESPEYETLNANTLSIFFTPAMEVLVASFRALKHDEKTDGNGTPRSTRSFFSGTHF